MLDPDPIYSQGSDPDSVYFNPISNSRTVKFKYSVCGSLTLEIQICRSVPGFPWPVNLYPNLVNIAPDSQLWEYRFHNILSAV